LIVAATTVRRVRRALVVAFGICIAVIVPSSGLVSAHAIVLDISPADGSALLIAPTEVVVTFSEPILADGLEVDVSDGGAADVPDATVGLDPADSTRVVVHLAAMGTGTYQVRVTARDEEDLHEVRARTSFAVGEAAPEPSAPVISGPEPVESGARWMFAAGMALLVGVAAVRMRWPDVPIDRPRRLRSLVLAGAALVLAGRIGVLLARMLSLGGDRIDAARTVMGTGDAKRIVSVVVALGCVAVGELPTRMTWLDVPVRLRHRLTCRQALTWLGIVNLAVLAAWGGHSALDGSTSWLTLLAKTGHLIGLGLWVGVLAVVVVMSAGGRNRRVALSAMSVVAVSGAVLTVVSGLVLASELVVSLTAWTSTAYGVMLAVKVGVMAVAIGVGLVVRQTRRRAWPAVELGLLTVVVVLGTAMATATPAVDPGFTDTASAVAVAQPAVSTDDLLVQLRAIPAHPGTNTLELRIAETRRPSPAPITSVDLRIGDGWSSNVATEGGLVFVDGVDLAAGESSVDVIIHRAGRPDSVAVVGVATDVPAWVHPPRISSQPIRTPLLLLAAAIALIALIARTHRSGRRGAHPAARREATVPATAGSDTADAWVGAGERTDS
jgi:copper transport protein